ncbi:MAG TPA: flagellar export protein FliJ [Candidatus Aquicultor sp.]
MEKFKFKLQPVLHHRQKKEDIAKKELADIKQLFEAENRLLEKLQGRLADLQEEIRQKQQVAVDAAEATVYTNYIERLKKIIGEQILKLEQLAQEVRGAQERLLDTTKDKKVLEKLHDKQYEEYRHESEKVEQNSIDELATVRYRRDITF